ncbi:hypothetical protein L1987_11178 [Smallanthus sonchifolius]|uniref:Uncharacterized protein n=1 Tax=Smallanthus sonchifolius TaxID=185202 RepID=A0ACB9JA91_9ASTR|nr:hypothetical protein L1987_11178 [Smallanthus sonchifolius]
MWQLHLVFKRNKTNYDKGQNVHGDRSQKKVRLETYDMLGLDDFSCVALGRVNDVNLIPYLYRVCLKEETVMVEVDESVYVMRVKNFSTWAPTMQKVEDNTEASGSDPEYSLDRESETGSEASNHAEQPQIIVKYGQKKLDDSTYEGTDGKINSVDTKNGDIEDVDDESSLSKPPGFRGQRFEDMGTSTKQNGYDGCGLVGNQRIREEEKVQGDSTY